MIQFTHHTSRCDGMKRREWLQIGSLSFLGLSLPRWLAAQQQQLANGGEARDVNCILLWLDGGLANMDTFDMKPTAPVEYRGEFQPIDTDLPGVTVCEHLPLISRKLGRMCQIRNVAHEGSQHAEASHFMLTGYPQVPDVNAAPVGSTIYPCIASVVARQKGWQNNLPPYVQMAGGPIAYSGAGYMGGAYNPLMIRNDPNDAAFRVDDVTIPASVGDERTQRRRRMLAQIDTWQRQVEGGQGVLADRGQFYQQAYDLVTSPAAKQAFDLSTESDATRNAYGRNRQGQSTLLARRLVEAGVRFVTVQFPGYDTHAGNFTTLKTNLPIIDQAWSALLTDLEERGMLENTLVICTSEFGRTPMVNGGAGRDHYPLTNLACLSGAGVAEGTIVGSTDAKCERVVGQSRTSLDYAATVFRLLGVNGDAEYHAEDGRPLLVNNGGVPIDEVFG